MDREASADHVFQRIAARDEAALLELYDEFAPRILGLLTRALASRREAEEALQSVFLKLWREVGTRPPARASVSAHLIQMARDIALSRRAAAGRAQSSVRARRFAPDRRYLPPAAQVALIEDRRELLSKILRQLPEPQREGIERVVFEGLSEEEIAAIRAQPLGRTQDELRAGLAFLRQRLLTLVGTWTAGI